MFSTVRQITATENRRGILRERGPPTSPHAVATKRRGAPPGRQTPFARLQRPALRFHDTISPVLVTLRLAPAPAAASALRQCRWPRPFLLGEGSAEETCSSNAQPAPPRTRESCRPRHARPQPQSRRHSLCNGITTCQLWRPALDKRLERILDCRVELMLLCRRLHVAANQRAPYSRFSRYINARPAQHPQNNLWLQRLNFVCAER